MKDTPETDKETAKCCISMFGEFVPADFARKLEIDRNEARETAKLFHDKLRHEYSDHNILGTRLSWET